MARGSVVKRRSGNYAIVYYVDRKQKWETIGPSRREAERALTARKREVDTGTWRELTSETLGATAPCSQRAITERSRPLRSASSYWVSPARRRASRIRSALRTGAILRARPPSIICG